MEYDKKEMLERSNKELFEAKEKLSKTKDKKEIEKYKSRISFLEADIKTKKSFWNLTTKKAIILSTIVPTIIIIITIIALIFGL